MVDGINVANPLQPGDAFTGLQDATAAGGDDAFAIDGTTFDPFTTGDDGTETEGFDPVTQTIGAPPLLNIGGGTPGLFLSGEYFPIPLATQDFDVYAGTGADATQVGSISTTEDVTNLFGLTNTEFAVTDVTPADGADASDLPAAGSVYDVLNLGNGFENIYTAIPGSGDAGNTVTDTFVTPFGNIDLSSLFGGIDASTPLDAGDAFTGLGVESDAGSDVSSAAASTVASDPLAFLGL
jgi:hypothetical protein